MSITSFLHQSLRKPLVRITLLILLIGAAVSGVRAAQVDQVAEGEAIFQQKCIGCHSIGQGDLVGPDLQGVTSRRDTTWLVNWILDPNAVLESGDPIAQELTQQYPSQMPNLGLTEAEALAVLAYIDAQSGGSGAESSPAPTALPAGDSGHGKDLFIGEVRLSGGGPACMSCHTVAGLGALGGGELGPDLTNSVDKYGEAGLASFLANPPTETMSVIWSDQPLTPEEVSDLQAFLIQAPTEERPTSNVLQLAALAVGGAAIIFLIANLVWRGRLRGVRRKMVEGTQR